MKKLGGGISRPHPAVRHCLFGLFFSFPVTRGHSGGASIRSSHSRKKLNLEPFPEISPRKISHDNCFGTNRFNHVQPCAKRKQSLVVQHNIGAMLLNRARWG